MATIKSASVFNGENWETPVPFGADAENISITSATEKDPTQSDGVNLDSTDVAVSSGDTAATAWTKFNRFRKRVANRFTDIITTAYTSSGVNNKTYSTKVINDFMTNVIGYTGTSTPSAGKISSQLSTDHNNIAKYNVGYSDTYAPLKSVSFVLNGTYKSIGNNQDAKNNNYYKTYKRTSAGAGSSYKTITIKQNGLYGFQFLATTVNTGLSSDVYLWMSLRTLNPNNNEVDFSYTGVETKGLYNQEAGQNHSWGGVFANNSGTLDLWPSLSRTTSGGGTVTLKAGSWCQFYLLRLF